MGREEGGTVALLCLSCVVRLYILACAWATFGYILTSTAVCTSASPS